MPMDRGCKRYEVHGFSPSRPNTPLSLTGVRDPRKLQKSLSVTGDRLHVLHAETTHSFVSMEVHSIHPHTGAHTQSMLACLRTRQPRGPGQKGTSLPSTRMPLLF